MYTSLPHYLVLPFEWNVANDFVRVGELSERVLFIAYFDESFRAVDVPNFQYFSGYEFDRISVEDVVEVFHFPLLHVVDKSILYYYLRNVHCIFCDFLR